MMVAMRFESMDLPGSGRTNHQDVVTARHSHFQGSLDVALAFDVAEVDFVILMGGKKFAEVPGRWAEGRFTAQKLECLP